MNVLKLGCPWSIGDGRNIMVILEPWLRSGGDEKIRAPQAQVAYNISVHDLMLHNVKQWDIQKFSLLFTYDTMTRILNVPLLDEVQEDCLMWKEEYNGKYSVKTGYKLYMNAQANGSSHLRRWKGI